MNFYATFLVLPTVTRKFLNFSKISDYGREEEGRFLLEIRILRSSNEKKSILLTIGAYFKSLEVCRAPPPMASALSEYLKNSPINNLVEC